MESAQRDRSSKARERGNEHYKRREFAKGTVASRAQTVQCLQRLTFHPSAILAYRDASICYPYDPLPLSNLAAAHFESGQYEACAHASLSALNLSKDKTDMESWRQKIIVRLAKTYVLLKDAKNAARWAARITSQSDRDAVLDSVELRQTSRPDLEMVRSQALELPRFKAVLRPRVDNSEVDNNSVKDQLWSPFQSDEGGPVAFMFCGVGDARNFFQRIFGLFGRLAKSQDKVVRRHHFTLLDQKPATLTRNIIIFHLLDEHAKDEDQGIIAAIALIYSAQIFPLYVWNILQKAITAILVKLDGGESITRWLFVPRSCYGAIRCHLRTLQTDSIEPYTAQGIRLVLPALFMHSRNSLLKRLATHQEDLLHEKYYSENDLWDHFRIVKPPRSFSIRHDKEFASLHDYLDRDLKPESFRQALRRLVSYVDSHWKPNMTMVDTEHDPELEDYNFAPEMGRDVLETVIDVTAQGRVRAKAFDDSSIVSYLVEWFDVISKGLHVMGNNLDLVSVEIVVGEMVEVFDKLRYDALEHRKGPAIGELDPAKFPRQYHYIHMSNVPDYVGGPLATFLAAPQLLRTCPGACLTSNILKNSPLFNTLEQFLAEYLLISDLSLVKSHFGLEVADQSILKDLKTKNLPFGLGAGYFPWKRSTHGSERLNVEELMSRASLQGWVYGLLLKNLLPPTRPENGQVILSPLNITIFLRLISHLYDIGYPAHWLSGILAAVCEGKITTTARAPREVVVDIEDLDIVHPSKEICIQPWHADLTTMISIWQPLLPFGLGAVWSLLPALQNISQFSIKLCPFTEGQQSSAVFVLLFWDHTRFKMKPKSMRRVLLDDELGDKYNAAGETREGGVSIVSTLSWDWAEKTAQFWLREDVVEKMKDNEWKAYLWRTDTWLPASSPSPVREAVKLKSAWLDDSPSTQILNKILSDGGVCA
ncbi:putative tetratricopeptide-like protein [Seiridium cardinale]|uniref:Tetratricopeptide-like protein n=1 Tax=Seiridium cardinale TaxID=138064 RepID=A0ABR2XEY4_9PEZI